jgi:hypothetical protein
MLLLKLLYLHKWALTHSFLVELIIPNMLTETLLKISSLFGEEATLLEKLLKSSPMSFTVTKIFDLNLQPIIVIFMDLRGNGETNPSKTTLDYLMSTPKFELMHGLLQSEPERLAIEPKIF